MHWKVVLYTAVAEGDVDPALAAVNDKFGDKLRVTSTPLRTYFNFAEHVSAARHTTNER